ncbi:PucR-like helix-turn-helix protein [Kutzneria buriramensis]|uniref:PucR-like helix-turn-helix protein n=2 Tax=Kutzneria buriramensis TaxID=1045776 RepID=A0A3E0G707_9PSEU|nr:PucR-like helix-turn-helix protein [Kutzneria buriramensis]
MNTMHADIWYGVLGELDRLPPARRRKADNVVRLAIRLLCSVDPTRDQWDARELAAVHTMGHGWAVEGWPLDQLLELLGKVCGEAVVVWAQVSEITTERYKAFTETGNRFMRTLLRGYQEVPPSTAARGAGNPQVARALLRGQAAPDGENLAPAYTVMAFRTLTPQPTKSVLAGELRPGVLTVLCPWGGYALVPAEDERSGHAECTRIHALLPEPSWAGVSWRETGQLPAGRIEAVDVVASALASRRPPGCYLLGDVLVEYAVLAQPSVATMLAAKIEPVTRHPTLLTTLHALVATDGNRSKAAADLIIHRSTLDYRLRKIQQLTGYDPTSLRELQILSTALAAHEATVSPLPPLSTDNGSE